MANLPTIKQLRYLVALAEHRHFGKAADACFVSQSAFSVAIKALESLLDTRLVDRTNKSVTITNIGKQVATQARLCLRDAEGILDIVNASQEPLMGMLKMGVIPTIAPFLLPKALPKIRKTYPKLELYLKEDLTQRVYEDLMSGELDLILIALPFELRNTETLTLFKDHFRLACRPDTQLVDPENYSYNRLQDESVLLLEDGHCLRDHALSACRIRNTKKLGKFEATSLHTLLQMVDSDLGITFVPEMAQGSSLLKSTRIKTWPLREMSYRQIGLAWRKSSTRADEFKQLGEILKDSR
ncbi:MAG: hydrogen peroxide-inducible genes activator [Gammaproteobacteria bacterium]